MHRMLFNNRTNALGFVVFILFGVAMLVGSEDKSGTIGDAAQQFASANEAQAEVEETDTEVQPLQPAEPGAEEPSFTEDDDLIDDTAGFEPEVFSAEPDVPAEPMFDGSPDADPASELAGPE